MTPPPPLSEVKRAEVPVFVDPSGRRLRRVRWLTWSVFAAVGAYLVLVLVPLLGGPSIGSAFLPAPPGQDGPRAAPGRSSAAPPSSQVAAGAPLTGPDGSSPAATGIAGPSAELPTGQGAAQTGTPTPGNTPSSTVQPSPTAPLVSTGPSATRTRPTTPASTSPTVPGKSGSAPGHTRRPTPTAKP